MKIEIIVAIITSFSTVLVSVIAIVNANRVIGYRIDALEKKQDKHNCLIERMVKVEDSSKSAHHRLDEIQKRNGE